MANKTFFLYLLGITVGTATLLAATLTLIPQAQPHAGFAAGTIVLFTAICTGLFFAGKNAAASTSKLAFNNLVSVSVFAKMLIVVAVLFAYQQTTNPQNSWFVGLFLLVYAVYTVFEVWFMTKLARSRG